MSLLIFAYRKLDINKRRSDLNYRLLQITNKLSDLQQYASNIGDGSISMSDMMNTPGSMFGRQLMFMNYAHNGALMGAQQKMAALQPQLAMQMQQMQPQYQQMYQNLVFKNLYDQERERMGKQEQKLLNEQEKEIQAEKQKIETQLKLLDQEYESCKQAEEKSVEMWKPNYTG